MKISEKLYNEIIKNDRIGQNVAIRYIKENVADGYDEILDKLISICENCSALYDIHMYETFVSDKIDSLYALAYHNLLDYLGIDIDKYYEDLNDFDKFEGE